MMFRVIQKLFGTFEGLCSVIVAFTIFYIGYLHAPVYIILLQSVLSFVDCFIID